MTQSVGQTVLGHCSGLLRAPPAVPWWVPEKRKRWQSGQGLRGRGEDLWDRPS